MWQPFDLAHIAPTPWKNGGGNTQEIVCWPPGAGMDDFVWRISVACIAQPGPFSVFAGVDRHITLLKGDGVHLHSPDHALSHTLHTRWQPWAFAGDVPLLCELLGGASQDFNVMTRRGWASAQISLCQGAWSADRAGAVLGLQGAWLGPHSTTYTEGQGAWCLDSGYSHTRWQPLTDDAVMLCVSIAVQED